MAGGSGGYIYIQTLNRFAQNFVNSTVEAKGGFGNGNGLGGSGGIIVFDGNFSIDSKLTNTAGGLGFNSSSFSNGCSNGAAGTVYSVTQRNLFVSNQGRHTSQKTSLVPIYNNNTSTFPTMLGKNVTIQDNAQVILQGASHWVYFDNFKLSGNASIALNSTHQQVYLQLSDRV